VTKNNTTNLHEFIDNKAKYLASKYKNGQMYQDLKQEALVVGYALLEDGVTCEKKITGAMRTRLNDFYNFGQLPGQQRVEQLLEAGLSKIKLKLGVPKV